jgi:hypothetical protein
MITSPELVKELLSAAHGSLSLHAVAKEVKHISRHYKILTNAETHVVTSTVYNAWIWIARPAGFRRHVVCSRSTLPTDVSSLAFPARNGSNH